MKWREVKHYMPLFVVLNEGEQLTETLIKKIASTLRSEYSPRHVPDEVIVIPEIPYTISGKKLHLSKRSSWECP